MSKRHPVVAVTGSSGAGTSTVKRAFEHIFAREDIVPAVVEGDSYHRFERMPMKKAMAEALSKGENFSHFGPEANLFDKLEELFKIYGETGGGKKRYYLHSLEEAEILEPIPEIIDENEQYVFKTKIQVPIAEHDNWLKKTLFRKSEVRKLMVFKEVLGEPRSLKPYTGDYFQL